MNTPKKNIICVPTDFSDVAGYALEHAVQIASIFDNDIALVHIVEESLVDAILGRSSEKEALVEEALMAKLKAISDKVRAEKGINVQPYIRKGRIYKQIVEAAQEYGCDSVIMGSHGASGMEQIIGSNASKVIAHSTVPVVVIKARTTNNGYKKIVMPIDLSLESKQKVAWGIHLAKKFDSVVHIITVKETDEFLKNRLRANIHQVEEVLSKHGIKHETKFLEDEENPAQLTMHYAEEIDADLILIMTQQEIGFAEFILGSYAQQIVNNSEKTPVMCVSPREDIFQSSFVI